MKHFSDQPRSTRKLGLATVIGLGVVCLPTYLLVPAVASPKLPGKQKAKPKVVIHHTAAKVRVVTPAKLGKAPDLEIAQKNVIVSVPVSLPKAAPSRMTSESTPDIQFVEELSDTDTGDVPETPELKEALKKAQDEFDARVDKLIEDQDRRIDDYRRGADQREREAQQREREGQQRKREGEQRARTALLAEQVIQESERNHYEFRPGREADDAQTRKEAQHQREANAYQAVLDGKQRETDQWQREFDTNTVLAIRKETKKTIAEERRRYQDRIGEMMGDDSSRRREANGTAAYSSQIQAKMEGPTDFIM